MYDLFRFILSLKLLYTNFLGKVTSLRLLHFSYLDSLEEFTWPSLQPMFVRNIRVQVLVLSYAFSLKPSLNGLGLNQ